jgi:hypothetical protein
MLQRFVLCTVTLLFLACGSSQKPRADETTVVVVPDKPVIKQEEPKELVEPKFKKPVEYNFRLLASDVGIDNPVNDRRSYLRVFIDKIEAGRTTIGLESQEKSFDSLLAGTRHLVVIEKFILDERKGKYLQLNKIDQPRPDFFYIDIPADRILILTCLRDSKTGKASYSVEFEREQ